MLVKNTTVSIIHLAFPRAGIPGEDLRKKYAKTKHARGLTFLPGNNDVPPELLSLFDDNKGAARHFEEGKLEKIEAEGAEEAEVSLAGMREGQARKLINDTIDLDLLKRWAEAEDREPVLRAIGARLKKLEPPKGEGEGGETEKTES